MTRTANKVLHKAGIARVLLEQAPKAILPFDLRQKSRQKIILDNGEEMAVILDHGTILQTGDVLLSNDNQFILVEAAIESIIRVTADSPIDLVRAAYHLGNRHIKVEVGNNCLQLEYDPILIDMLNQLGVKTESVLQAFQPETGAYGAGHKHGHDETFAEDYALAQAVYQVHDHDHKHDHSHPPRKDRHHHTHAENKTGETECS